MNQKLIIALVIITAIIILSGCVDNVPAKTPPTFTVLKSEENVGWWTSMQVIHDNQNNVTCWSAFAYNKGGISCIPDSQLKN